MSTGTITERMAERFLVSSDFALVRAAIKSDRKVPFNTKAIWNALPYSYYAYGIYQGCGLAKLLDIPRVSVIEFGVAGGNGLLAMEQHAQQVEKLTGVKVDVYGFDTGEGMTPPRDHRDMPYRFKKGNYRMDVAALENRLKGAKLILGDVKDSAAGFLEKHSLAPIAFASFDMDYYSSTMDAFSIFGASKDDRHFLPRIFMYFDDIIGTEISAYNDFVGELAAINDFNAANEHIKIAENRVFRNYSLNFNWYHQSYIMHRFKHAMYDTYVSTASAKSLSLKK